VIVEANFGDGMYSKLLSPVLQRIYPCSMDERSETRQNPPVAAFIAKKRAGSDGLGKIGFATTMQGGPPQLGCQDHGATVSCTLRVGINLKCISFTG